MRACKSTHAGGRRGEIFLLLLLLLSNKIKGPTGADDREGEKENGGPRTTIHTRPPVKKNTFSTYYFEKKSLSLSLFLSLFLRID